MFGIRLKLKNIFWTIIMFLLFSPVGVVFAQLFDCDPIGGKLCNPIKVDTLSKFLGLILEIVIAISTPIIVLMIVYSGFLFVKAQGNPEGLVTAKKAMMWTMIGAIIILGAFVLSKAIEGTVKDLQKGIVESSYVVELG